MEIAPQAMSSGEITRRFGLILEATIPRSRSIDSVVSHGPNAYCRERNPPVPPPNKDRNRPSRPPIPEPHR
ncbi:unnamed protein product, partial [Iphiclides podalirius]